MRLLSAVLTLILASSAASAETIAGRATVIDGDTLEIHGELIRILDIDAPEKDQFCVQADGDVPWECGAQATLALMDWIGAQVVTCETDKRDRYKRHLARCTVGGTDLGEWVAAQGWAVPYRDCKCETIRAASEYAELNRLGIWSGPFEMPWDWRKARKRAQLED